MVVHKVTGEVVGVELAPGEEGAFDFLLDEVDGPSPTTLALTGGVGALVAGIGGVAYTRRQRMRMRSPMGNG